MKAIVLVVLLAVFFLNGCSEQQTSELPEIKVFSKAPNLFTAANKEIYDLPFDKGEIDLHPFFVQYPQSFFFSNTFNNVRSLNLETGKYRTFNDPDMSIYNFSVSEDAIYLNDANKSKVLKLSFDLSHTQNFLGQMNEDRFHNGHNLTVSGNKIFQYNYDHPLITVYSLEGKKLLALKNPTMSLQGIETFENGNILLFYPERVIMYSEKGELLNELTLTYSKFLVYPDRGIYLLSYDAILFYNQSMSLKRKYLVRDRQISLLKRAKTQSLYYSSGNTIYHLLKNGNIQKMPVRVASNLKQFIPTYDNHFLIHDTDGLYLYNQNGQKVKQYELLFQYFDFYFFRDSRHNYYMADARSQLLKVTNEATYSIVENILYSASSFSRDSNLVFDITGNLFFVNRIGGNIERITTKFLSTQFETPGVNTSLPYSKYSQMLEGPDRSVYLFSRDKQTILKYDSNGNPVFRLGNLDSSVSDSMFGEAQAIAVDNMSILFVLDTKKSELLTFDKDGDFMRSYSFGNMMQHPVQMMFDRYNMLWISENSRITVFNPLEENFIKVYQDNVPDLFRSFYITPDRKIYFATSGDKPGLVRVEVQNPYSDGLSAFESHRFREACLYFQECRKFLPDDPELAFYLATCYVHLGRNDDALKLLRQGKHLDMEENLYRDWKSLLSQLEETG